MMRGLASALAALAVLVAPAAMAQDANEAMAEDAVPAVAEIEEAVAEAAAEAEPPQTYILSASDRFLAEYASESWLDPALEICLEEGEQVSLARTNTQIATMELRGPLCTQVGTADEVATIVAERADPELASMMARRLMMEEQSRQSAERRVRAGSTRGVASASSSRSTVFRVASGSSEVLAEFPRGTTVTRGTELCLARGQQVTLISSQGQRVTYRGPGCARRNAQPSESNLGGFTFGWNSWDARVEIAALP